MAKPGVVLKRAAGSNSRFAEHAGLPTGLGEPPSGAETATGSQDQRQGRPQGRGGLRPRAERREAERRKEEAAREKDRAKREKLVAKAQAALDEAQGEHEERAETIEAERAAIEKRVEAEKARWKSEKERLTKALRLARE